MQSNRARAAIALGAIAVAVVLFIVLRSSDEGDNDSGTQTTQQGTPSGQDGTRRQKQSYIVVVRNGKPVGGIKKMEYRKGERVRFVVRSDVADEIHVHGYDRLREVRAGGSVRFDFPADLEGVFEIELEQRKEQIAELRVNPS
jgi:hypothetical protein